MNWDWEKLRENQQKFEQRKDGGGPGIPRPPQLDELLEKFKGFKSSAIILVVVVLLVLVFGKTTFFTVDRSEVGVIQRFGAYNRTVGPGLNFKFPSGIEKVTKVNVETVETEEFGFDPVSTGRDFRTSGDTLKQEAALMLTGDLNVAVVPWIVQYRRSEPRDYLFRVKNVKSLLRMMSEATMRTVVGDRSINEVISRREEIADAARVLLQKEMDQAMSGITIVNVEMKKTNVPEPVQASFNEVNQAIQEKEQTIYKAREEYNKAVPLARGEAKRVIKDAEGYAIDRVNRAQGDAAKFMAVYKEYAKAKDVTKKRMYLEAMLEIFPKLGAKYIIDSDQKNMLPFLNMGNSPAILPSSKQIQ
ncbi:MAG: FtsH protease activity modulator HflK [Proteobacteria bacterium]|nr:FtsH protease activity modulator HflK [Pseudomonadota bacterium]MBU1389418.1 FtsH protease activity modulator HflK [Pseudomonadota bacterium]MBU1541238.1 FtsH protease activity modulator HflK [Pseudomonadota bacterium]MBU2429628.1 FtsH protease activity modulator HflK [Pseudomonadota bacterium]MBU2481050.1 FtsH protease activity modulator HflK [Pseudomonadota bacterium]